MICLIVSVGIIGIVTYVQNNETVINEQVDAEYIPEIFKEYPLISGFRGATFDGQFVYFAPYQNNHNIRHGYTANYNTKLPFDDSKAWNVFDIQALGIGFQGALYHNDYVYYVPYFFDELINQTGTKVVRYNTNMPYVNNTSWEAYGNFDSYEDGIVVGDFVYFSPHLDKNQKFNTKPLRYDTNKQFSDPAAWERIEFRLNHSYVGAAFDGRFIYYSPYATNGEFITPIMIYDTTKKFTNNDSWKFLSIHESGYSGVGFNGTHVIFAPMSTDKIMFLNVENQKLDFYTVNNIGYQGVIETEKAVYLVPYGIHKIKGNAEIIEITNSIKTFTPKIAKGGYWGGTYDGKFVYFTPYANGTKMHGDVLRYDTTKPFEEDDSWEDFKIMGFRYN